jgi:hypothetical protein
VPRSAAFVGMTDMQAIFIIGELGFCLIFAAVANAQSGDVQSIVQWSRAHPDGASSVANWIFAPESSTLDSEFPEELKQRVSRQLRTRSDQLKFAAELYETALKAGDLPIADLFQRQFLSVQRIEAIAAGMTPVRAEMQALRGDAKRPRDVLVELGYPATAIKTRYLATESAIVRSRWLLAQGDLSKTDRERIQPWHDRVAWILGTSADKEKRDAPVTIVGRLTHSGAPMPFVRVAFMKPVPELLSGGGYQSFINGLDTVLGIDVPKLPDDHFWCGLTDAAGDFKIQVAPGGPYAMVVLAVQRAAGNIDTAGLRVPDNSALKQNIGLIVPDGSASIDTGVIDVSMKMRSTWSQPLLDARSLSTLPMVIRGNSAEIPILIANRGTSPLEITRIRTDCGCSAVSLLPKSSVPAALPITIGANETVVGYMTIKTNTTMPLGLLSKALIISSTSSLESDCRVECHSILTDEFEWSQSVLRFALGEKTPSQTVQLKSKTAPAPLLKQPASDPNSPLLFAVSADKRSVVVSIDPSKLPRSKPLFFSEFQFQLEGRTDFVPPLTIYARHSKGAYTEPEAFNFGAVKNNATIKRTIKLIALEKAEVQSVESLNKNSRIVGYDLKSDSLTVELQVVSAGPDAIRITLNDSSRTVIEIPLKWKLVE